MSEYWKWPEATWAAEDAKKDKTAKIAAGVDLGTTSAQAAIMCGGELISYASVRTGVDFAKTAEEVLKNALDAAGLAQADLGAVVGTGFGVKNIAAATKTMDEVHCHAKGARYMFGPEVHTVIDMGGQTVKAIRLYDWDRVRDIFINDKCGTGEGRNIEMLCDMLEVGIEEIGPLSLDVPEDPQPVSNTCWAFAKTETLGLFGRPEFRADPLSINQIYASHLLAVAWRILGTAGKLSSLEAGPIRLDPGVAFTGGLAKNPGITKRVEDELKITAMESKYDPMLAGAIGAALLA